MCPQHTARVVRDLCIHLAALTFLEYVQFFVFWVFLGRHPRHMEVPRLEVALELQAYTAAPAALDASCVCHLCLSLRQRWNLNPLNEARDHTCFPTDAWVLTC